MHKAEKMISVPVKEWERLQELERVYKQVAKDLNSGEPDDVVVKRHEHNMNMSMAT